MKGTRRGRGRKGREEEWKEARKKGRRKGEIGGWRRGKRGRKKKKREERERERKRGVGTLACHTGHVPLYQDELCVSVHDTILL